VAAVEPQFRGEALESPGGLKEVSMKQMEYTIKVITDGPVDPNGMVEAVKEKVPNCMASCTNFRVLPIPRTAAYKAAK
jgi:hypothetical protein